ncbi:MAG: motility associated factor glycosyltransferase family protein [Deltaproteobacteria bacterium]|nr:motility associated factor glycosyltransferase family protein [Deltaproteobacteria bacterium]
MTSRILTRTGNGAWLLGGQVLHPAEDPLASARSDLGGRLEEIGARDLVVMAGSGIGWHIQALLDRPDPPALIVYEPHAELREAMKENGPALITLSADDEDFVSDEKGLVEALGRHLVYSYKRRVAFFSSPAYEQVFPDMVDLARTLVNQSLARSRSDAATRILKTGDWLDNMAENIVFWPKFPDVTLLQGSLTGIPALVVGAGPSLDQSLDDVAEISERALVFSAASALLPLKKAGVFPHVTMALEAKDESRQFEGVDHKRTLLAAASAGHPNHFLKWSGPKSVFHLQPWIASLAGMGTVLPSGGHVTSAAFSLALLWGCDPIILIGQDLAYTHGRIHAAGRPGGEDETREETVRVPAIGGGTVQTSPIMLSYLLWYEESASSLEKSGRTVYNATPAGALIPGFEHRALIELRDEIPPHGEDLNAVIEAVDRLPCPTVSFLLERVVKARIETQVVLDELNKNGLEAARAMAEPESAASAVLEDVPAEGESADAQRLLKRLQNTLTRSRDRLHSLADSPA